jgi:hypothetical protein
MRTPVPGTSRRRAGVALLVLAAAAAVLAGCAAGPNPGVDTGPDPAGFWLGLWQGFIVLPAFVVSLFTDSVSIYEVHNSGNWYDAGYVLGLLMALGGSAGGGTAARRRR